MKVLDIIVMEREIFHIWIDMDYKKWSFFLL